MSRIYKRNSYLYVDCMTRNGERIRQSTGLKDTLENRKYLKSEIVPQIESLDTRPKKSVEFYYRKLMRYKRDIKHSTIQRYNSCYENHIKQFADYEVDEIKPALVKEWVHKLKVGPKSVRMCVSLFSQIMEEARLDEEIEKNPLGLVRLPKLIKYEPQPFSDEEIELLLKNSNSWFRNVLGFLFLTGMRIGEVLALEWHDINDSYIIVDKSIREGIVTTTKTNNIRRVPIFKDLRPFIQDQLLESGMNKRVFPGIKGASHLNDKWKFTLRRAGMSKRVLYQARHTFAIKALDSGLFKASQISYMLGHSSTQMLFQKYAKFIKSEVQEIDLSFSAFGTKVGTL